MRESPSGEAAERQFEGIDIYFGWWVVAALFLSGFMLFGGGLYGFVLIMPVVAEEFGWTHTAMGGLVSAFWLTAPVALFGGSLIKRVGARRVFTAGVVIEAACTAALAGTSSLWAMYGMRMLMGLGKVLFSLAVPVLIARWFTRHFALACAVAWAGWHVGGLVLAPAIQFSIDNCGWRRTLVGLGGAMIVLGLLPAQRALRIAASRTDAVARKSTGASPQAAREGHTHLHTQEGIRASGPYRTLLKQPTFLLIALSTTSYYFTFAGTLAHQSALIRESGISPQWSSTVLGLTAAFAAAGVLVSGWIADRVRLPVLATLEHVLLVASVLALLIFARWPSPILLLMHVACFGFAVGGGDVLFAKVIRRHCGGESFAFGYSLWYFFAVITLPAAPILAGWMHDLTGNYRAALECLVAASVASYGATLAGIRRPPPERSR